MLPSSVRYPSFAYVFVNVVDKEETILLVPSKDPAELLLDPNKVPFPYSLNGIFILCKNQPQARLPNFQFYRDSEDLGDCGCSFCI